MNKHINKLLSLAFVFSLCACNKVDNTTSNQAHSIDNEVEQIFFELTKNNFTVDFTDCYYDLDYQTRNEKLYYTDYALQAEGDFGFSGIAQGNELIFKYTLEDNEVVSSQPLINYNNGVRYESIFDYTYGMSNFEYYDMAFDKDEDGYYVYKYGHNINNDRIITPIILRMSGYTFPPEELKFKIVKDVITFEAVVLSYDFDGDDVPEGIDTIKTIVYDIGKTENPEIKKYLEDGKSSKDPLDLRFYKLIHPYLFSQNYTIDLDYTDIYAGFKFTSYCTENAVYNYGDNTNSGYLLNQGVVTTYNITNEKVNILATPKKDETNYYNTIYGDLLTYTFNNLDYSSFVGYKDDINDNVYYLTDSYIIYILAYICYNDIFEENYCDKVKVEIINDERNEFKLYFEMYNKQTNRDLGTIEAKIYDLNNTSIPAVNNYLSLGDNPNTQTKDNLANVLNKFKNHNYSMDFNTGYGVSKYYYTQNYMYAEMYGNTSINYGFIKENESIYEFKISDSNVVVDKELDYGSLDIPYTFPGLSSAFMDIDDFGYISTISDELYNVNNYVIDNIYGQDYWSITNVELVWKIFNYYFDTPTDIKPKGVGVVVKDDGDNSKLSLYLAYIISNGEYNGYAYITYYDIGTTAHPLLESYIGN